MSWLMLVVVVDFDCVIVKIVVAQDLIPKYISKKRQNDEHKMKK